MNTILKIKFVMPCVVVLSLIGMEPVKADMLLDPIHLLRGGNELTGVGGFTLSSETDYDTSEFGISLSGGIKRSSLDFAIFYPFSSEVSIYGSLEYDLNAKSTGLELEEDLDGFQVSFGGLKNLNILPEYPSVVWAEINFLRESFSSADDEFNSSENGDLSSMELSVGMIFQLHSKDQLSASIGGELILVSNGDLTETYTKLDNFGPPESETSKTNAERSDKIGLKAIVSYELSSSLLLNARINFLNENKLAIGVSRSF